MAVAKKKPAPKKKRTTRQRKKPAPKDAALSALVARRDAPDLTNLIDDNSMELVFISPQVIAANDKNWKQHPALQRETYADFVQEVGWAGALLYNRRTQTLLDGHMRLQDALERGLAQLPVLSIDVDPEREDLILRFLDPIGMLFAENQKKVDDLSGAIEVKAASLQALLATRDVAELNKALSDQDEDDLMPVPDDVAQAASAAKSSLPPGGISLVLGEQYDYIVLLFRTPTDFVAGMDHFGIDKVRDAFNSGIGVGRVVDGSFYIREVHRVLGNQRVATPSPMVTMSPEQHRG